MFHSLLEVKCRMLLLVHGNLQAQTQVEGVDG